MHKLIFTVVLFLSFIVTSTANNINVMYEQQGLVLIWGCDYDASVIRMSIGITSVTGGSGSYTVFPYGEGSVTDNIINNGEGFTYYFTENDQLNNNIGFVIDDGLGNQYFLDPNVATQLYLLPFNTCLPNYCPALINQPAELDVTSLIYQAENWLISESTIKPNRDVIYKAGTYVKLNPGFEVLPNGELEVLIEDCIPPN